MEELERYTPTWIDSLLANYEALVGDASELARDWPGMDPQEQIHHRSVAMQGWGMRRTLGALYRAGRLTPDQMEKLAALDRALLEDAAQVQVCYGPSLRELVNSLLEWGTPLVEDEGTVRLDVPLRALPTLAQVLAGEAT